MKVSICALTYQRPHGLARLLEGLNGLTFEDAPPEIRIVIVDNDPSGSGRATCERLAPALRWPLVYVVEPRRGIAFGRNAALDNAGDADWLCFIDDDEAPDARWLNELLRVQREHDADVVAGPVIPVLPDDTPAWIIRGRFFHRRRHATGHRLSHAFTNNVLFRSGLLAELNLRFDEQWALLGCGDRHFFQRIGMAGYRIVWADEAIVSEWIPASRANARWLIQRMFRVGITTSLVETQLRSRAKMVPILLAKSGVWILIGLGQALSGLVRGWHAVVQGLRSATYAVGLVLGIFGLRYEEYRKTHGH